MEVTGPLALYLEAAIDIDDILSRLGTWGVYMLPFMRTVRHQIHFGTSHLLLPVIPAAGQTRSGSSTVER